MPMRIRIFSCALLSAQLAALLIGAAALAPAQQAQPKQVAARKMLYHDGQHALSNWQSYPVRTVNDFAPTPPLVRLDRFGGRLDRSAAKTGYFYTQAIDGRWWFVDPDGHLYLNSAVAAVAPGKSANTTAALLHTYGTSQAWMDSAARLLLQNGFNGVGAWSDVDLLRDAPTQSSRPLAYTVNLDMMSAYGAQRGGTYQASGHKGYPQDTIFVFDPAFKAFAVQYAARAAAYRNDPNLIGYFSDNELPLLRSNLDDFLHLPAGDAGHRAAARWMRQHKATEPTDELRAEFLEFEAERYFSIVTAAIHRADPHHLYLGCRFYGQQLHDAELFRAIAPYAGVVSINVYGMWQVGPDLAGMWERESGKPFMVTEFYAKGEDSGMANRTGAGWLVHTQDDRGLFYETFVLSLLQSRACVGWHWFKYQDNDPDDPHADPSNRDSNKGIVDRVYKPYDPLLDRMSELNQRMYGVVDGMDAGQASAHPEW